MIGGGVGRVSQLVISRESRWGVGKRDRMIRSCESMLEIRGVSR